VFSVDPELVVPEEKLYIRVEDTVAVTADGVEVLTGVAPLDLEAVEAVMQEKTRFPFF
jgi:Xaa-Pro aminopeptidase